MATLTVEQAFQLALTHHQAGRLAEAEAIYRQVLAVQPRHADALHYLGVIAHQMGRHSVAVDWIMKAITLDASNAEAHSNLGAALKAEGQLDAAIAAHRQAIALKPAFREAHKNLGNALKDQGHLDAAIAAFRQAIALDPDFAEAHGSLALALLLQGDFLQGWEEYGWRWKGKEAASLRRNWTQPQWDGAHLSGRTILLHAEQGFGDSVQFIRYLPLVQERGGKILIECQAELQRLLQIMAPDLPVAARGQPLPAFDVHCPLLSLPRIFATDLTNIPRNVPYLHVNAASARIWRDRHAGFSSSIKVGLVWAGRPSHPNDRSRSLKLAALAPLAGVPGVRLFSMQKGDAASEASTLPAGMDLTDVAEELRDFADTAALIANLDLIIAVDTAVVHLAGAMGKPVWTLLPFAPDWRWLLDRSDSPWYPTMRLFRQPVTGDWGSVIRRVAEELAAFRP